MKKIISIILVLSLLISTCGCEYLAQNENSDFVSERQNLLTDGSNSAVGSDEQKTKQDKDLNSDFVNEKQNLIAEESNSAMSSKEQNTESNEKGTSSTGPTICPPAPNNFTNENSDQKEANETEITVIKNQLPEVKFSVKDSNVRFTDMVNLSDGGFAVSGHRFTYDLVYSIIQVYDENSNLKNEYSYGGGNGFDKIAVCSDGGFVAASYCPPCITKINSNLETEWFMPYENVEFEGAVQDIEEISPEIIAVLFVSLNSPDFSRRLKIAYLDQNGELIETVDLMKNFDPQDADIIADGNGGFYLLSACDKELAKKYQLVAENYDNSKATEAVIMHFSAERNLCGLKL